MATRSALTEKLRQQWDQAKYEVKQAKQLAEMAKPRLPKCKAWSEQL
jgi:hypothetical protein